MAKQTMGAFLAILRKANGYTQQDVAEKLSISNRTLSSWETGRTTPDIYMLPAIADLYGVTVDELLQGERGESDKQADISEAAWRSVRKAQIAKLSLKTIFVTSFACFGAVLFIVAACLNLYTSSPVWIVAVIAVTGGSGIIVCTVLQVYFYYKAKYGGGIVLSEDLTDDKKSYALAIKRKTQIYYFITAIPFLLFTIILGGIYCVEQPQNAYFTFEYVKGYLTNYEKVKVTVYTYLKTRYLVFLFICFSAGLALLLTYLIYSNAGLKNIMNDTQWRTYKHNLKLAGILLGSSGGAMIATFALFLWGTYSFYETDISRFDNEMYFLYMHWFYMLFILTAVLCTIVSGIIYAVKHKKQIYEFK